MTEQQRLLAIEADRYRGSVAYFEQMSIIIRANAAPFRDGLRRLMTPLEELAKQAGVAADVMTRSLGPVLRQFKSDMLERYRADRRRHFFDRPILWQLRVCARFSGRRIYSPVLLWRWLTAFIEAQPPLYPER